MIIDAIKVGCTGPFVRGKIKSDKERKGMR